MSARALTKAGFLWGPLSGFGLVTAAVTAVLDQASKQWVIGGLHLGLDERLPLVPFVDLTLVQNKGISYGWFQQSGPLGQWALLAAAAIALIWLWIWLSRASSRLLVFGLALIIGGAIGNGIDRLVRGWVVDFVLFYITTARFTFHWYVFNLADVAIVAGVVVLLYDSFRGSSAAKAP